MIMKKTLDLSGMKFVLIGYIIELAALLLAGRAISQLMEGKGMTGVCIMMAMFAGMLLVWFGVNGLRNASVFFGKAAKPVMVRAILAVIAAIVFGVSGTSGGLTADRLMDLRKNALETALLLLILGLIWLVTALITTRSMLRGCGHVAEQADDPLFSLKCMKTWRTWNLAVMLMAFTILLAFAIFVNVLKKTLQQGLEGEALSEALAVNIASSILLASVIATAVLIFLLIVHIIYLFRLHTAKKMYHLTEVEIPDLNDMPAVDVEWPEEDGEGSAEEDWPEEDGEGSAEEDWPDEDGEEAAEEDVPEENGLKETAESVSEEKDEVTGEEN